MFIYYIFLIVGSRRGTNLAAFYAQLTVDLHNLADHQTIVFNTVHVDHGHLYSANSGEFVAPIAGTYFMSQTISTPEYNAVTTELVVNGVVKAHYITDSGSYDDVETNTANIIVDLQSFDRVWVRLGSPAFERTVIGTGWGFSSFSGHLLP